jgi:hypothetical protein
LNALTLPPIFYKYSHPRRRKNRCEKLGTEDLSQELITSLIQWKKFTSGSQVSKQTGSEKKPRQWVELASLPVKKKYQHFVL